MLTRLSLFFLAWSILTNSATLPTGEATNVLKAPITSQLYVILPSEFWRDKFKRDFRIFNVLNHTTGVQLATSTKMIYYQAFVITYSNRGATAIRVKRSYCKRCT